MSDVTNGIANEFIAVQQALVGRYSLEQELGRGGMGIVYLAHEVALDRPVALKLLPPTMSAEAQMRERFLREARTAAKLSHPNIVPIYAVHEIDGFVFFAMAYVDGGTLGQRIRARGPLQKGEATRILREVAWALAYAHSQGIVHRDIKPDNILLESGSGRALVTDFGIAQVLAEPGLTAAGEILGTAEFMSPEQASGEPIDARSDVYALGVLGFYLLSGRLPFEAESVRGLLAKHITQPPPAMRDAAPETPRRLAAVVDRCLQKEPDERFADGQEVADELGKSLEERRELPIPVRVFLKHNRESVRPVGLATLLSIIFVFPQLIVLSVQGSTLALVSGIGLAAALAGAKYMVLDNAARQLLKAGYLYEGAIGALKADLDRRREEIAFEYGTERTPLERKLRIVSYVAGGGTLMSIAAFIADIGPSMVAGLATSSP